MIFLAAGTADGRTLAQELLAAGYQVAASVTSRYGAELLAACDGKLVINEEPLDEAALIRYAASHDVQVIVDASHPYAVNVSKNAMMAAKKLGIPYLRYERSLTELSGEIHIVHSYEEAASQSSALGRRIFLTTGSHNLKAFTTAPALADAVLIARVLPTAEVLALCEALGLTPAQIVALQGPFSTALNRELFRHCQAEVIVTKNSGQVGGTDTKLAAAKELGLPVVLIDRPQLAYPHLAHTYGEVLSFLKQQEAI